jgi:hypothetical protein
VQVLDGMQLRTRNDARRFIRDRVGGQIYAGRRPIRSNSAHTAVTIRQITAESEVALVGETDTLTTMLQVDVLAKEGDADWRATITGKLIRIAVNNYFGTWGSERITGCLVRRQGVLVTPPGNASDDWPCRYSMDLEVKHNEATAIYPVAELKAAISAKPRSGGLTAISAAPSVIPQGRTITFISWEIIEQSTETSVNIASDTPHGPLFLLGGAFTGVNWDFVTSWTPPLSIQLELTDSSGAMSATSIIYEGA